MRQRPDGVEADTRLEYAFGGRMLFLAWVNHCIAREPHESSSLPHANRVAVDHGCTDEGSYHTANCAQSHPASVTVCHVMTALVPIRRVKYSLPAPHTTSLWFRIVGRTPCLSAYCPLQGRACLMWYQVCRNCASWWVTVDQAHPCW